MTELQLELFGAAPASDPTSADELVTAAEVEAALAARFAEHSAGAGRAARCRCLRPCVVIDPEDGELRCWLCGRPARCNHNHEEDPRA
jgi:hypothetical protein